jgi:hypothetical protein
MAQEYVVYVLVCMWSGMPGMWSGLNARWMHWVDARKHRIVEKNRIISIPRRKTEKEKAKHR